MPFMARLVLKGPEEILTAIGERARGLRLHVNMSQVELAQRAAVPLRSLQRFESTGRANTDVVVRIAFVLAAEDSLDALFALPEPRTMDEVLAEKRPRRQRARGSR